MQRQSYNYWVVQSGGNGLALPASVRVTSTTGAQVVDYNIITGINGGQTLYSSQQFAANSYYLVDGSATNTDAAPTRTLRTALLSASPSAIGLAAGLLVVALIVGVAVC